MAAESSHAGLGKNDRSEEDRRHDEARLLSHSKGSARSKGALYSSTLNFVQSVVAKVFCKDRANEDHGWGGRVVAK